MTPTSHAIDRIANHTRTRFMTSDIPRSTRAVARAMTAIAAFAVVGCADGSPMAPDAPSTMHVEAGAVTATTIGQELHLDATVLDAEGEPVHGAEIHWDLSAPDVLARGAEGAFRVLGEGTVQATAVWPKDPSVRATITVTVDAGLIASACIVKTDQAVDGAAPKCAEHRVVVRVAAAEVAP